MTLRVAGLVVCSFRGEPRKPRFGSTGVGGPVVRWSSRFMDVVLVFDDCDGRSTRALWSARTSGQTRRPVPREQLFSARKLEMKCRESELRSVATSG
jgi:hypothetical protein